MIDGLELGLVLTDAISKGLGGEEREAAIATWEQMLARAEKLAALTARNLAFTGPETPQTLVEAWKRDYEKHA